MFPLAMVAANAAPVDEVDGTAIPVAWLKRDRVSGVAIEFSEGATDVATVPFIVGAMGTSVVEAQVDEVDGTAIPVAWLMRDKVSRVTVEYCGGGGGGHCCKSCPT